MSTSCKHDTIGRSWLTPPSGTGDIFKRRMNCPTCGAALEVEYIKTVPMVDDIELSPRWEPHGVTVLDAPSKKKVAGE